VVCLTECDHGPSIMRSPWPTRSVGLITRPEESYRVVCLTECDHGPSIMRSPWPTRSVVPWLKKGQV
jgi:hypothetical protein